MLYLGGGRLQPWRGYDPGVWVLLWTGYGPGEGMALEGVWPLRRGMVLGVEPWGCGSEGHSPGVGYGPAGV